MAFKFLFLDALFRTKTQPGSKEFQGSFGSEAIERIEHVKSLARTRLEKADAKLSELRESVGL